MLQLGAVGTLLENLGKQSGEPGKALGWAPCGQDRDKAGRSEQATTKPVTVTQLWLLSRLQHGPERGSWGVVQEKVCSFRRLRGYPMPTDGKPRLSSYPIGPSRLLPFF